MTETKTARRVSYSQFSMWLECPHRYKLIYVDRVAVFEPGIPLIFGSAMHDTLQSYLNVLYNESVSKADEMDLESFLHERMIHHFQSYQNDDIYKFVTKEEMIEHLNDGIEIIRWFKKKRTDYFSTRGWELVGIELPLEKYLIEDKMKFVAFLDVVLYNKTTGKYLIIDFKTSTRGWSDYQKRDEKKTMQVVLYKAFFAEQHGVSLDKIDVQFVILKRKLLEECDFPQKRVLKFTPPSGKPTINKTLVKMKTFVESVFDGETGERKADGIYPKIPTDSNCRFCPFKNRPDLCDRKF